MIPHPFQSDYLADIRKGWKDGFTKQLVVSPTGSGKTCMFSWVTKEFTEAGHRALILVDQDELVWQTKDKLQKVAGIHSEVEKAEWRANAEAQVVVATVQSMAKRLDRWPGDGFGLVIADEADKSVSTSWQTVLKHFDGTAKVLGFTATPNRTDRRNLGEYYENCIERENLVSLIGKGFLSPISIKMLPITLDVSGRGAGKDFTEEEADEIITPHLGEIAKAIQEHAAFRRTLVFLPLIKTCEKFNDVARSIGLSSEYIFGVDGDRDSKLARFRRYDFDVLSNSMLLTRGVDIPEVDCIVPCRPTKSVTLYCLDSETEVLTEAGWSKTVAVGDSVAAFHPKTGQIIYTPATGVIRQHLQPDERFISLRSQSVDIRVTDQHRMLYDHKGKTGWKFKTASELAALRDTSYIPVSGRQRAAGVPLSDDDLRFIGWVLTDGTINKLNNAITITQGEHQPWLEQIEACIRGCGFKFTRAVYKRTDAYKSSSDCVRWTISKGKPRGRDRHLTGWGRLETWISKDVSPLLFQMTERQFDVFIEAVHLGDGAKQLNTDGWTRRSYHICFGKKERAEKIQILAILNGYRANLSFQHAQNAIWVLHLKKQSFSRVGGHSGDRPSWQAEGYKPESCWCVENEIGTLITRRNGKVAIVGNCQMIGRGARIAAGKTECLLMDFLYQASKKLVCRPAHLVAKTQEEAEQITELTQDAAGLTAELVAELDLVGLVETATSQREEALRKRLEENKNKQAKTVSAEEFAMQYHSMETAEFEPTMKWESDAITEKQTKWLSKAHIDLSTIRGKGHASKLLSLYFAHKPINMASYAQRKIMAQMGHPDAWHATAAEARQFFADLNKPKEAVLL